ncbi:GerA spore germination protein [Marininema mesophilum]|uniref:GerA spore germination protein n=2 Tax=Marininema mesophilum TaxID=1048340 RepID=A0A1H3B6Y6_9BACL|nr:GerA spore germination protein [Marininema mesophilum]
MADHWQRVVEKESNSVDFVYSSFPYSYRPYSVSYYRSLINNDLLHAVILPALEGDNLRNDESVRMAIPIEKVQLIDDVNEAQSLLLKGYVMVLLEGDGKHDGILIPVPVVGGRSVTAPEVEFTVLGPKEAFVERLDTNLGLVRRRLPVSDLRVHRIEIGSLSKTQIAVLHIEGIANPENVKTVQDRVKKICYDDIIDSSFVAQMIKDQPNSVFPELLDTERPDRVAGVLGEGKVVILVDGASQALIGPSTFSEFFTASDDYFIPWQMATFFRFVRILSSVLSIIGSPLYVALLTYHYELLPQDLVGILIISRETVPFPPILEAIILEWAIELIREAGARLPTKVGQTIGIVGGIVIGTAAVQAGLTSNILLIIVAASALSTFTSPIYQMGNAVRLIRFPMMLAAQMWGILGIVLGVIFLCAHLIRMTSLGNPYLEPLFPLRISDFKDSYIRLPFSMQRRRPLELRTKDSQYMPKGDSSQGGSSE